MQFTHEIKGNQTDCTLKASSIANDGIRLTILSLKDANKALRKSRNIDMVVPKIEIVTQM